MLGFAGFSGAGKTTLLERLIPILIARGLHLGLIKSTHHDVEMDRPGKDSHRLRQAGASQVVVASRRRTVHIVEHPGAPAPDLRALGRCLAGRSLDLILVEGFKSHPIPKVEVHRPELGHPLLCEHDAHVIALAASTAPLSRPAPVPVLDLDDPDAVARFIAMRVLGGQD